VHTFEVECVGIELYDNSCPTGNNGVCEDGGASSSTDFLHCDKGTDCADCGPRFEMDGRPSEDTVARAREYLCQVEYRGYIPSVLDMYLPEMGEGAATSDNACVSVKLLEHMQTMEIKIKKKANNLSLQRSSSRSDYNFSQILSEKENEVS
jgi:hypothetical protein